jgi:hypothetical protein
MSNPQGDESESKQENTSQEQNEPAGNEPPPEKPSGADDVAAIRKQLLKERAEKRALESKLSEHERAAMSDQEKAVAAARDEGRAQALQTAGKRLAAAEFRAAAAGKVPNIDAILEVIDPAKFISDDGEPNLEAINVMVTKLAAAPEKKEPEAKLPAGIAFPGGVRERSTNGSADTDWMRLGR